MSIATMTLRVANGRMAGSEFVFEAPTYCVVGRSNDCDVCLPRDYGHTDVSRHHCALEFNPPEIRVRDLGSRNGTFVNGEKIGQRHSHCPVTQNDLGEFGASEIRDGDEIQVGDYVLRVGVDVAESQERHYAHAW